MSIAKKIQHGFSMIEVLVSLIIIGVGMLGLSGLQITSIKGTANAHSITVATMIAFELGERMRANQAGVDDGHYGNKKDEDDKDDEVTCSTRLSNQCRSDFCSPRNTARLDLQEVMCGVEQNAKREGGVANLLVNGRLGINCPGGCDQPNAIHNITLSWNRLNTHQAQQNSSNRQTITIPRQTMTIPVIP